LRWLGLALALGLGLRWAGLGWAGRICLRCRAALTLFTLCSCVVALRVSFLRFSFIIFVCARSFAFCRLLLLMLVLIVWWCTAALAALGG